MEKQRVTAAVYLLELRTTVAQVSAISEQRSKSTGEPVASNDLRQAKAVPISPLYSVGSTGRSR